MPAAYTRLDRPCHPGMIALACKEISECPPLPVHHAARPMIARVGTAVPTTTPTPVQRADFRDPNSEDSVTAQKITSMTGTRKALFWARSGLITYAAVVARNTSTVGNHTMFSDQSHHTARKPHREPNDSRTHRYMPPPTVVASSAEHRATGTR